MGSISSIIMLLLPTVFLLISSFAEGRSHTQGTSNHIVKTIKVPDGDVVDCIDIYKQPSFRHPLLWNHTLQIEPSEQTSKGTSKKGINLNQPWKKYGSCPQGSIPILRQKINTNRHFKQRFASLDQQAGYDGYHSHAVVNFNAAKSIHGGYGTLNTWNPTTGSPEEFSLSQIWVVAGKGQDLNTMEAGWHVFPNFNGDSQTRLFIFWTKDGYHTGCYNLQCEGFVQTNKEIVVGGPVEVSTYGGKQSELEIGIEKDKDSGNWWLHVHGTKVGYWPATLFTSLAETADYLGWGGEVFITEDVGEEKHPPTQMGSGHLPKEGYKNASYIRDIKYIDTSGSEIHPSPDKFETTVTDPTWCYNVHLDNTTDDMFLYFGGPGCQSEMNPMI